MPASQLAASSTSAIVAGQPSLSLEIPDDFPEESTNLWLPLSPFPSYSWDVQEDLENVQRSNESATSSPPPTPGLCWDSRSSLGDVFDTVPQSVFEDWDDPPYTNSSVIEEENGIQTVLITPESAFYNPPPPPPPFSTQFFPDGDQQVAKTSSIDESEPASELPLTLITDNRLDGVRPTKGRMLFLDTVAISSVGNEGRNSFSLSPSLFYPPMVADEVPSWAPKGFMHGPDVPLDPSECIYSAGDVSPLDRWDTEKMWSPISLSPLRTAPCN